MFDWLENDLLLTIDSCEPASSDASFRRYFRVKSSRRDNSLSWTRHRTKENIEPFIRIADLLTRSDVNVPTIFQQNLTDGFLLLEDFGSQCFLDQLNANNATDLYQTAFDTLFKLQTQTPHYKIAAYPAITSSFCSRELAIFEDWFLDQLLDIQIPESIWDAVQATSRRIRTGATRHLRTQGLPFAQSDDSGQRLPRRHRLSGCRHRPDYLRSGVTIAGLLYRMA